tara:strand:- start:712 stop:1392 length:681 start_codon:yes stop_codon:yes gene_type:complete
MLKNVEINQSSLKEIQQNITKHSPYPHKVKIIVVTKNKPIDSVFSSTNNKMYDIGENRIKETQQKFFKQPIRKKINLHFIGQLQTNKISKTVKMYNVIHSVDKIEKINKINNCAKKYNKTPHVFLQLKLNPNPTQAGFSEKEIIKGAYETNQMLNIKLIGLMVIGPNTKNKKKIQQCFYKTKKIQEYIYNKVNKDCINTSMGMSQDYILALKEGATHIRIGTRLFI